MEKTGINGAAYAEREFLADEPLPWDNIDVGVGRDFLYREYKRAIDGKMTTDCRKACSACGLKCEDTGVSHGTPEAASLAEARHAVPIPADVPSHVRPKIRLRVEFSKTGRLLYLSHLELITSISRALRRAEVPFDFSKGFHPKPEISFCPPLNVGVAGLKEYFDVEVFTPFDVELYSESLSKTLPDGLKLIRMSAVPTDWPSLTSFVSRYEYVFGVSAGTEGSDGSISTSPDLPLTFERLLVRREDKELDMAPSVEFVKRIENSDMNFQDIFGYELAWAFKLLLRDREDVKIRLGELSEAIFGIKMENLSVVRTRMFGHDKSGANDWKEPL